MIAPGRALDDTWEWLQLPTGWAQYEVLERIAICLESKVPSRVAADIAYQQVGADGRGMTPVNR